MDLKRRIVAAYLLIMLGAFPAMSAAPCFAECADAIAATEVAESPQANAVPSHCQAPAATADISSTACDPHSPVALQSSTYVPPKFQNAGVELEITSDSPAAMTAGLLLREPGAQPRAHSRHTRPLTSLRI